MTQSSSNKELKHQKRNGNDNKKKRTDKYHKSKEERVETLEKNAAKSKAKTRDKDRSGWRDYKNEQVHNDNGPLPVAPTMEEIEREEDLEIALEAAEAEAMANQEYLDALRDGIALDAQIDALEAGITAMHQELDAIENIHHVEGELEFAREQLLDNIEELEKDLARLLHDIDMAIEGDVEREDAVDVYELNELHQGREIYRGPHGVVYADEVYEHVAVHARPIATPANIPVMLETAETMVHVLQNALNNVRPLVGLHMDAYPDCG